MTPAQILAAILLAMAISAVGTWQVQDWRYGARLAELARTHAQSVSEADRKARKEEQRLRLVTNKVGSDAREEIKAATVAADDADTAGDRMHVEASEFAARACASDSGVAQRGASATRAAMVLSELFQRADKRAGELAAAYDRARIAGRACEAAYGALNKKF